ncbi:MAG: SH3 domain-containing protein [Spirochaetaceae bacterium]|jgi:hypothetical protein|nr:SH3 domain-containing protein [Spirochaetaceae bacterium]
MGWGVLLWYTEEPGLPAGTVLPIQLRSNIEQAWIGIVPGEYSSEENQRVTIPLPHLEFFKSRRKAERYAADFTYAHTYAETIQDGLPVRDEPENNARRIYRLKEGEIIKILEKAEGVAAISSSGSPLEGDWYRILTKTGSTGYCFSLRLNLFEHTTGSLGGEGAAADTGNDRDLELVLSRVWYPESYGTMINSRRIDLEALEKNYSFTPGLSDGKARIHLEQGDAVFPYRKIEKTGDRSWNFTGTSLTVSLRSETALELQWENSQGEKQSAALVTLPLSVENIVNQEKERRQNKFQALFVRGPSFTSSTYGTLVLSSAGKFTWDEINELPEGLIPNSVLGSGAVDMDYELGGEMIERYTGALALQLNAVSGRGRVLVFAYILDNQGLRMEYIPPDYVSRRTVSRRAPEPFVIYFSAEG